MKLLTIPLKAGQSWSINRGRFIRVFDAIYPVKIKTTVLSGGSNQETTLIANTGAEFTPFSKAELISDHDQTIRIAYSELLIFDNRLGVEAATVMQTVSPQTTRQISNLFVDNSGRVQILFANTKRKNALIATGGEVTFFDTQASVEGFKIDGDFDEQSNQELWAIADAGTNIQVMEFSYE